MNLNRRKNRRNEVGRSVFRYCLLSLVLSTFDLQLSTAQDDLSKQLEVTRAYTPRVGRAEKLPVAPDMTDTVRLRPEISYRITSTASSTSFTTLPFEAATISEASFDAARPLYIRAGAGAPFATTFDLYFTPHKPGSAGNFGIFANHSGSYSKIVNDLGVKANAAEMTNGAGLWGTLRRGRYSLEADASYDNRLYNPYGVANVDHPTASSAGVTGGRDFVYDRRMDRFTLGLARAGVSFGDNFTDLGRFNFRIGVDGGYAHAEGYKQTNFDARITGGRMFGTGRHGFEIVATERGAFNPAGGSVASSQAVTLAFAPRYLLQSNVWSLRAGVDVRYIRNTGSGQDYTRLAPSFELRANLAGGAFVPFASYTSRVADGDRETLSRRNPYVVTGGTTAWIDDARIGFEGDLGDLFSYRFAGGISRFDDYQLFTGVQLVSLRDATGINYPPMWFSPLAVDGTRMTAGAEVGLHNLGGFGARLYGNWNRFEFRGTYDGFTPVGDLPRYDAGLELSWRWKDAVAVRLGGELIGEREYLVRSGSRQNEAGIVDAHYTVGSIAPVIDLTFGADVRVATDFWVFLEGENLANQVLYPYPHYRGLGASVIGGIKVVF